MALDLLAMHKTCLGGYVDVAKSQFSGYIEIDPSGRYGRFRDVLGKGAMKTVYRAFDEVLGVEVAWNQVKLGDVFRSPKELQRLYSEVHLLKNLNHESILRFYTSWIDVDRRNLNFITEMFTSGTLREYRQKYKCLDIRAIKNWARQILCGLAYLHGHSPPVIHRDLKCNNIFVNGHLGQVKIGDFGLATILRGTQHAHSVIGTPEFMAPELYEEEYNELVDVYSFGMCVLEMLTSEYPYSECSNPAQIYKKVTSGKLPQAFYKIQNKEAQQFVAKCLETVSKRLSARELLLDPFLASDEEEFLPVPKFPSQKFHSEETNEELGLDLASDPAKITDMTITGTMNPEDDTIFLKVQISEKNGQSRNIYFPFDTVNDTATDVAMEMVKELEIGDWEPLEIAEMIEEEIASLVPDWKESGSANFHHQHSFNYEDDADNVTHHPFYDASSHSSSYASLPAFSHETRVFGREKIGTSIPDWLQDDESSYSSLNSFNSHSVDFCSDTEDDYDMSGLGGEPLCAVKISLKSTRCCPANHQKLCNMATWDHCRGRVSSSNHGEKITRMRSLVDMRSQLLHRSLVEEVNKRRLFKTVGAVENIGFQEPGEFLHKLATNGG